MTPEIRTQPNPAEESLVSKLRDSYFAAHPERSFNDKLTDFFSDLERGCFWRAIDKIDGPAPVDSITVGNIGIGFDYAQAHAKATEWTRSNFNNAELKEIFGVCLDIALHPPETNSFPGNRRGQSTIHTSIIDRPDSNLGEFIDEETKNQLINGSLWEELGMANPGSPSGYTVIFDVFENHADVIDPKFAKKGIQILDKNLRHGEIDIVPFPNSHIDKYWELVKKIDGVRDEDVIPQDKMKLLIKPYIIASLGLNSYGELRFGEHYDSLKEEPVTPSRDIQQRLSDPLVLKYLRLYPDLLADVVKIARELPEESDYIYTTDEIGELLPKVIRKKLA